jgi:hypothetical protein
LEVSDVIETLVLSEIQEDAGNSKGNSLPTLYPLQLALEQTPAFQYKSKSESETGSLLISSIENVKQFLLAAFGWSRHRPAHRSTVAQRPE